jgi:serine/threonine protein kinase
MTPERWQRIKQIFDEALAMEANRRVAFLDQACAEDAELRREVTSLLAADEQNAGFLSALAIEVEARESAGQHGGLLSGKTLGRYEIQARIGAGGMGQVYLARDTRLKREVALKVLPAQFTSDAERLQRFKNEAWAASALSHQNIITIFDIDEFEGAHFIAAEYIEGLTLRQRLESGKPRLSETLDVAIQIAAALEAAHKAGIVHRDIKPENIMVRPDGLVKVLDFGIAKLTEQASFGRSGELRAANSTLRGVVLGTPRYMSPEQARGQRVDARTDIFSLGVVLYEMLAGRPPFDGVSVNDVIAEILKQEPLPLSQHAPEAPDGLQRVISKSLAKPVEDRYQTIRDLQRDLQTLKQEPETDVPLTRNRRGGAFSAKLLLWRWRIAVGGLLAALLIGGAAKYLPAIFNESISSPPSNLLITHQVNQMIRAGNGVLQFSISHDSELIAYDFSDDEGSHLWVKRINQGESGQITYGKVRDRSPVWSPNQYRIAFISDREGKPGVWSVTYPNGAPMRLADIALASPRLKKWSRDGQKIYVESSGNLYLLNLQSGTASQVTQFDPQLLRALDFSVSSDEEQIAYTISPGNKSYQIMAQSLRGGQARPITHGEGYDRWPSWLPDGKSIVFSSERIGRYNYQLYRASVGGGTPVRITFSEEDFQSPAVSPDGNKIFAISQRENSNIFSYNLRASAEIGHTSVSSGQRLMPEVSPDGNLLAYQSINANTRGNNSILVKPVNGQEYLLTEHGSDPKWAPDGKLLAFIRTTTAQFDQAEIWKKVPDNRGADNKEESLVVGGISFNGYMPLPYYLTGINYNWSPDDRQIAYVSAKSGQPNLWVIASDGSNPRMISHNNDRELRFDSPFWAPDGKRIAYSTYSITKSPAERVKSVCVQPLAQEEAQTLLRHNASLRLLGWSETGQDIFVALSDLPNPNPPQRVVIRKISSDGRNNRPLFSSPSAYLHSFKLSSDGQKIAFVSREAGKENIWVISTVNWRPKKLTANDDPMLHYSGITWAIDGKTLFYSKQTGGNVISMIENFK